MRRPDLLATVHRSHSFRCHQPELEERHDRRMGRRNQLDQCRGLDQENLAVFLENGKQVYVEGRLQTRSYDDREGQKAYATEVIASQVLLLGGKAEGQSDAPEPPQPARNGRTASSKQAPAGEDEFANMVRLATTLGFSRNFRAGFNSSKWHKHCWMEMFYALKANGLAEEAQEAIEGMDGPSAELVLRLSQAVPFMQLVD